MPRTEEAYQRMRDTQRAKILEGAWKVFASKGWGGTMAEMAAAAEVSQRLAYRYFSSNRIARAGLAGLGHPSKTAAGTSFPGDWAARLNGSGSG